MANPTKNKCVICGIDKVKLIDAQMEVEDGILNKVKVCSDCWKNLWGKLLNSKEVKIL